MDQQLRNRAYDASDCRGALRGEFLPRNLGNDVVRLCVLKGIRHNPGFAFTPEIEALARHPGQEVFARARNARLVMSGYLPDSKDMPNQASRPYCIWYPDVASEDSYRKLAKAFPELRYQIGRACAVAGYATLYEELDLRPDPSIAEEARESVDSSGSRQIYESIMSAPLRYGIMDDYHRSVELDTPHPGAFLNGDTATRKTLAPRRKCHKGFVPWQSFNITEDWSIEEDHCSPDPVVLTEDEAALLYLPLPRDLPTVHKDLLILMAAYAGNMDRYARLRRPRRIRAEFACLVRGTYHSTEMALWLHRSPDVLESLRLQGQDAKILRRAIHARLAMNNSIGHILGDTSVPDDELPYWLWFPTVPSSYTLWKLAQGKPAMRPQCARACIAIGYKAAYRRIMDMPDPKKPNSSLAIDSFMIFEAQASGEREFFETDLQNRQENQNIPYLPRDDDETWKEIIPWRSGEPSSTELRAFLQDSSIMISDGQDGGMYDGLGLDIGPILLHLSSTDDERAQARAADHGYTFLEDPQLSQESS